MRLTPSGSMTWRRSRRMRSFVSGIGIVAALTLAAGPAQADEPAGIAVGLDATRFFNQSFQPVLSFGVPLSLQAQSTSGQPVVFTAAEGCSATQLSAMQGGWSTAVLAATSSTQLCRLTLATDAGNGFAASTSTYFLRTRMGQQAADLPALGRTVAPKTSVILGASGLKTDRGQPITLRVTKGSKHCKVSTVKGRVVVAFSAKHGQCTVWASAPGIPGQYLPLQRVYVFRVTGEEAAPSGKPSPSPSGKPSDKPSPSGKPSPSPSPSGKPSGKPSPSASRA